MSESRTGDTESGVTIYPVPKPQKRVKVAKKWERTRAKIGVAVPKPRRIREPEYRKWINELPCLLVQQDPCDGFMDAARHIVTECAHVRGKGAGGGDEQCVGLCGKHHRWGKYSLHNLGVEAFDKHWGVRVRKTARELRRLYLRERAA